MSPHRVGFKLKEDFIRGPIQNNKGEYECVNCGKSLAFDKRRTRWCSDKCAIEYFEKHTLSWDRLRHKMLVKSNFTCKRCHFHIEVPKDDAGLFKSGEYYDASSEFVVDHIVPICMDGEEFDENNLQVLCKRCERIKTRSDMRKWTRSRPQNPFEVCIGNLCQLFIIQTTIENFVRVATIKKRKELTVKDLETFFPEKDPIGQMLINQVRGDRAKAFQDEKGEIDFEYPVECEDCSDDCNNCVLKSFTFKAK